MNAYFFIAGILCFLLGLAHSILGEYLIFKNKRNRGALVPSKKNEGLKERHLRILWATWHMASVFGGCFGAFFLKLASDYPIINSEFTNFLILSSVYTMFTSSILVLIGTKGRHPGWIVLMAIGVLLFTGNS